MTTPLLQTRDLSIGYTQRLWSPKVIAQNLNVRLDAGQFACLIGPNGAGKSTLLRTIAGMQRPLQGSVRLQGDEIRSLAAGELATRLSIVLTERISAGMMTAYALVALGRYPYTDWTGRLTSADEQAVRRAIEAVDGAHLAERQINELSDGERQKIMIARALAQDTPLILLDEPTAYLDLTRRLEIVQMLRQLAHTTGKAILLSIHDLDLALRSADVMWLMPADGRLITGAPEDLVLEGGLEQAFSSHGIRFDAQTGAFRLNNPTRGRVKIEGAGLALIWTQRALERVGIETAYADAPDRILVRIQGQGSEVTWQVSYQGEEGSYTSLEDLIGALLSVVSA